MTGVCNIEVIGRIEGQAGGAEEPLCGRRRGVGGGVAGVSLGAGGEAGDGGHIAVDVDPPHAVVGGVGDELVPQRIEHDVGGFVDGERRRGTEVTGETARACTGVTVIRLDECEGLAECRRREREGQKKGK